MNRRDLTRSVIALPAGFLALHTLPVPAQAAPPAADPDRDLLALCRRYMSLERRQNLLTERQFAANEAGNKALEDRVFRIQKRYVPHHQEILAEIVDAEPKTPAGMRAKARVFMTRVQRDLDGNPMGDEGPLWSLCRDLLGYDPGEGAA
ncbi:hypothetical protein MHZ93_06100 [Roseomonas sp. ACRSG]|nr:hypothetical protein [Roseomonas sp. ACRSG]